MRIKPEKIQHEPHFNSVVAEGAVVREKKKKKSKEATQSKSRMIENGATGE